MMSQKPLWSELAPALAEAAKPAIEAVRARKSVLLVGPPGSGKTMVARRLATELSIKTWEKMHASAYHTIMRLSGLPTSGVQELMSRPFRAPHHTVSIAGMVGDGKRMHPGEMSLAHGGILYLDEAPEFSRGVLEAVALAQREHQVSFPTKPDTFALRVAPADFVLVAAAMPCPCGASVARPCACTPELKERYLSRLSALRLDVTVELEPLYKIR